MQKRKTYNRVQFSPEVLKLAIAKLESAIPNFDGHFINDQRSIEINDEENWQFDSDEEFFAALRNNYKGASLTRHAKAHYLHVGVDSSRSDVTVSAPTRPVLESIFEVFEAAVEDCRLPMPETPVESPTLPRIFIGHGRSTQWRQLKDHLQDQHGYLVEAYEVGARAGHTIRDILDDMMARSDIAFLILTAEDETSDGATRARQNVVHELGLFQGKLGFPRAIAVLEEGVEEFSNLHGIQQLRFGPSRIREIFGDVLAVLKREFAA